MLDHRPPLRFSVSSLFKSKAHRPTAKAPSPPLRAVRALRVSPQPTTPPPVANFRHISRNFRRAFRLYPPRRPADARRVSGRSLLRPLAACLLLAPLAGGGEPPSPAPKTRGPDDSLLPAGRYVYERHCQTCHGRWGDARGELAATMFPKPRKFSAGIFKYRSTPPGKLPTDEDLTRTIRRGLAGTSMPSFSQLSDREVRTVVEYVKSFSKRWNDPAHYADPLPVPPAPAWMLEPDRRREHQDRGAATFTRLCTACHGSSGQENPAPPTDLTQPLTRVGNEPSDLFRVLTTGIDGTPMPAFAEATTDEERWELVAYLERLRQPPANPPPATPDL